jgi:hypothetical protein
LRKSFAKALAARASLAEKGRGAEPILALLPENPGVCCGTVAGAGTVTGSTLEGAVEAGWLTPPVTDLVM